MIYTCCTGGRELTLFVFVYYYRINRCKSALGNYPMPISCWMPPCRLILAKRCSLVESRVLWKPVSFSNFWWQTNYRPKKGAKTYWLTLFLVELALIMDRLYGGVCYAGIDIDPELKYPKGAGRVAFSNQQSYIAAISARFVQLQHGDIDKRVSFESVSRAWWDRCTWS